MQRRHQHLVFTEKKLAGCAGKQDAVLWRDDKPAARQVWPQGVRRNLDRGEVGTRGQFGCADAAPADPAHRGEIAVAHADTVADLQRLDRHGTFGGGDPATGGKAGDHGFDVLIGERAGHLPLGVQELHGAAARDLRIAQDAHGTKAGQIKPVGSCAAVNAVAGACPQQIVAGTAKQAVGPAAA